MAWKNNRRISAIVVAAFVLIALALYVNDVHINCRFGHVEEGKFYKSGRMPPNTLKRFVEKYNIKTVIDLRNPGTGEALCPEEWAEIDIERKVLQQIGITHAHIPSRQVPEQETLDMFFIVMDDPDSYPVLLHCHHGTGRAELFSAVYRIEYMGWSVQDAINETRLFIPGSSFAPNKSKGKFLANYVKRNQITENADPASLSNSVFLQTGSLTNTHN